MGGRSRPSLYKKGFTARITNVRIVDGDSIECQFNGRFTRVRLYAIDAPELAQPGGPESAESLLAILRRSEPLLMEAMGHDHYERTIGLIYSARSHRRNSVNLRMVREGNAYAYTRFGGAELGMRAAERDAQSARRGVWRSNREGGERPRDYRRRLIDGARRREKPATSTGIWTIIAIVAVLILLLSRFADNCL